MVVTMGEMFDSDSERGDLLDVARSHVGNARGLLVVGDRGAGRTHFLQSLIRLLEPAVRERVWIGDDVDRLDAERSSKVADAVRAGRVVPVMATAPEHGSPIDLLVRDGLVTQLRLSPLKSAEVLRVAESFLGGPLDPKSVPAFVPSRPGGDLVILREALAAARGAGVLAHGSGGWRLTSHVPPDGDLRRLILARLGEGPEAAPAVTLLDVIAMAPELSVEHLEMIVGNLVPGDPAWEVERLEALGVIEVFERSGILRPRLRDPIIELLLPQTMGRVRRRRMGTAIIEVVNDRPTRELVTSEALALVQHALQNGRGVHPLALKRAAELAVRSARPELAWQLATLAVAQGSNEAQLVMALAESQLGRSEQALARLDGLLIDPLLEPDRFQARDDLRGLVASRLADRASAWSLASMPAVPDGELDLITSIQLSALAVQPPLDGRGGGAASTDDPVVLEGERLALEASVASLDGRMQAANALLDQAEALLRAHGADSFRVRWGRVFAGLYECPVEVSRLRMQKLSVEAAAAGRGGDLGLCEWMDGALLAACGKVDEAIPELTRAVAALESNGIHESAYLARVSLAIALAARGSVESALDCLEPVLLLSEKQPFLEGWALHGLACVRTAAMQSEEAEATFCEAADAYESSGYRLWSLLALLDSARAGRAGVTLARVESLGEVVEGRYAETAVRFVRALASNQSGSSDPAEMGRTGEEFNRIGDDYATLGMHSYAAEAYSAASALFRRCGRERPAAAAARLTEEQLALCGPVRPALVRGHEKVQLSDREAEIAQLASEGHSNREVADRLVLSIRTVETHLLRVYRKLGIRGRTGLSEALTSSSRVVPTPMRVGDGAE
ncbi:LuxR C-terminal-related transcriptional regulator [Herbiconiux sp. CPCC 203407]|uniref:LuxR C-terminal-related transcriptional regulator n=1 Tax=Herbiconiux oxytropis TaxID=2970915 RepID=A0AA41XCZ9_9MICO|nr:LuxR C-terminal-related transcriptional regulator [Herbiconiux oxytropis]MCS5720383.1 LuxR C-terminal-related transcriptional regulator [Herbiconiux oxytropis]MCS5725956.1 LuxR C-terminal-related transcriptional regulator [Herbiconiux oxytropis]